jgi:hypothetical protein
VVTPSVQARRESMPQRFERSGGEGSRPSVAPQAVRVDRHGGGGYDDDPSHGDHGGHHGGGHGGHHWDDDDIDIDINFYFGNGWRWPHRYAGHHAWWYDGVGVWWYWGARRYYCPPWRFSFVNTVYVSRVYEHHYYYGLSHYGVSHRASYTDVVELVDEGWDSLSRGSLGTARRRFAQASDASPRWGLPKVGYALAAAASGYERPAERMLEVALAEDAYAVLEVPRGAGVMEVVDDLERVYTLRAERDGWDAGAWAMLAVLRVLLDDLDGATEAAFNAEGAGLEEGAAEGLLDLVAGGE